MLSLKKEIVFLLLIASFLTIPDSGISQSNRMKDRFYLGAINYLWDTYRRTSTQQTYYQNLSYNMMQSYSSHADTTKADASYDGGFFGSMSLFSDSVYNTINFWNITAGQNSLIFERERVLRPAYGQRSTYKAEYSYVDLLNPNLFPKYGFNGKNTVGQICYDNSNFGNGIKIKKCIFGVDDTGYIVNDLYENCEQVNRNEREDANLSGKRVFSDIKQTNYDYKWFIKPRMRIDADYALSHPNDTVAILYVNNFDGNLINSFTIKCKNFMQYYGGTWHYDGGYLDMFYQLGNNPINNNLIAFSVSADALMNGRESEEDWHNSRVDYYIKWMGKVDMYLDYIRVDDEWAHYLFTDINDNQSYWQFHQKINEEIDAFSNQPGFGYFWIDEFAYNNLPCVAEVNRLIQERNPNTSFVTTANIDGIVVEKSGLRDTSGYRRLQLIDTMINNGILTNIYLDGAYPFNDFVLYPNNVNRISKVYPISEHMNQAQNPEDYNCGDGIHTGIQFVLQNWALNTCKTNREHLKAKNYDLVYGYMLQVHSDELGAASNSWALREPTNEEIRVQSYIGLALGAKLINNYSYYSCEFLVNNEYYYSRGLTSEGLISNEYQPRYINYYGQQKWNSVISLNHNIKDIGNYMYPVGELSRHLIYDKTISVNKNELGYEYINNIKSKIINTNGITHFHYDSSIGNVDDDSYRYWELGFFNPNPANPNNPLDKSKYFLAVNKRCTPVDDSYSDERDLYVKFDSRNLQNFTNWKLVDALTNTEILTFDKNSSQYLNAGIFQPGEGKLYKLAPVMQEGGTLVTNESVRNVDFKCKGNVNTNGNNLILGGCKVYFSSDCSITANGSQLVIFSDSLFGSPHCQWNGIIAEGISDCQIYWNNFKNIKSDFALRLINCSKSYTYWNNFLLTYDNATPVNAISVAISNIQSAMTDIQGNYFQVNNSNIGVYFLQSSETSGSFYFKYNNLYSINNTGNLGMLISGVNMGSIEDNRFTGFKIAIASLNSSASYLYNDINLNRDYARGVFATSGSMINMGRNGNSVLGGNNSISTLGNATANINVVNSTFYLDEGYNFFNINSDNNPNMKNYHLFGYFPVNLDEIVMATTMETYNCFKRHDADTIQSCDVTAGYLGPRISFTFNPYACIAGSDNLIADFIVNLGNNAKDTIYKSSNSQPENLTYYQTVYKNLCRDMRRLNYDSAKMKCTELLTNYTDSVFVSDVITKLYLSTIKIDSAGLRTQQLKTFLEQLIINHSENVSLVTSANYSIQKCKVSLNQYASALTGFEDIIIQNPYSYEGLVASWDYAATALMLDTTNGAGGMTGNELLSGIFSSVDKMEYLIDTLRIKKISKYDRYDKSVFTPADRKLLFKTTGNVLFNERDKQLEKVKDLEIKSRNENGKEGTEAKKELEDMKALNEAVKTKRPKSQIDYVAIVNDDIKKVFRNNAANENNRGESVPKEFSLYQNYPNPFNPVTKISFDLPKDAKIKLIVYDILGREVTRLLNSEFKQAGKHIIEFDAMKYNLASGVYFYRIESGDFNAVKKMVLIK